MINMINNFVKIVTMPYDGNVYRTPNSKVYIRKDLISRINQSDFIKKNNIDENLLFKNEKSESNNDLDNLFDTLKFGNIIVGIDKKRVNNLFEIQNIILNKNDDDIVIISYIDIADKIDFKVKDFAISVCDIPEDAFKYFNSMAVVTEVDKGGVAEKAGMHIGDIIVKLDGEEFDNDIILQEKTIKKGTGEFLNFEVINKNEYRNVKVEIIKYGIKITVLYAYLNGLIILLLGGFFVVNANLNNKFNNSENNNNFANNFTNNFTNNKYALITGLSLSLYSISFLEINSNANQFFDFNSLHLIFKIFTIFITNLFVPFLIVSLINYPHRSNHNKQLKKHYYIAFGIKIISIIYLIISLFFLENSIWFSITTFLTDIIIILYFLLFSLYYRIKGQKIFQTGSFLPRLAFSIFLFLFILDTINNLFLRDISLRIGFSFWGVPVIPILYIISIYKSKPYDIELKVKRNIQYFLLVNSWRVFVILATLLFLYYISIPDFYIPNLHFSGQTIEVLGRPLTEERYKMYSKILVLIIFALYVAFIRKFNHKMQDYFDFRFNKVKIDYKQTSEDFNSLLLNNQSVDNLAKEFLNKVSRYIQVKHSGIVIINENNVVSQHYIGINDSILKHYVTSVINEIIDETKKYKKLFEVKKFDVDLKYIFEQCKLKIVLPIYAENKLVGLLFLGDKISEDKFTIDEIKYLESITNQIAFAIEKVFLNSKVEDNKRLQQELEFARKIQLNSLPQKQPIINNLEMTGLSIPALEVGGDFYDFLNKNENEVTLVVGDVSGKGTSAALYMSKIQGIIRTLFQFNLSPKEILEKSNQLISENINKGSFISSIVLYVNTENGTCKMARAGHLPLYLFRNKTQKVEKILPKGIVLGTGKVDFFNSNLEEIEFIIEENDIILLVSDGVTEARNSDNQEFEEENLIKVFQANSNQDVLSIRNNIIQAIQHFSNNVNQFDDITVLIAKYHKNIN